MEALIIIALCLWIFNLLKNLGLFGHLHHLLSLICHSPHFWPVMKWIFWIWLAVWVFSLGCEILTGGFPDEWISRWWDHRHDK